MKIEQAVLTRTDTIARESSLQGHAALIVGSKYTIRVGLTDRGKSTKKSVPGRIPLLIYQAVKSIICQKAGLCWWGRQRRIHVSLNLRLGPRDIPYPYFINIPDKIFVVDL